MKKHSLLAVLLFATNTFAAGREIAPRPIGPTPYYTYSPQTAFAGNRFLTTWIEPMGEIGYALMGVLHDASGRRLSDRSLVIRANLRSDVHHQLIAAGNSFALFLMIDGRIHLRVLAKREGRLDAHLYAAFVDLDGAPLAPEPILLGEMPRQFPPSPASAIWTGDRWLVAWPHVQALGINVAVIRNRRLELARTIPINTPVAEHWGRQVAHLAFARTATTTLLVWTERHDPICRVLPPCGNDRFRTYAERLTLDAELADSTPLEVPSGPHSLSVATSGEELMIVTDGKATVVDANARRVRRSTTLFGFDAAGDVLWNGSAYVIALRYQLAKWYLAVAYLDRDGNILGDARGVQTLAADVLAPPSIVGPVIAIQEGDAANGVRAVVYDETRLTPLPPPPPPPMPRFEPDEDGWFFITWDPVPGAELYVVDGEDEFWWSNVQIVRGDDPLRVWVSSPSSRVTAVGPGGVSSPPPRRRSVRP